MTVEMVFNELSLAIPLGNKQIARRQMTNFINTLLAATSNGIKRKLSTKNDFDYLLLSLDYQIVQWRNDSEVEREERSFLRTLQDKNDPPLPDIADLSVETNYLGTRSIGLEYAFVFEALAISIQSNKGWDYDRLKLTVMKLEEGGELIEDTIDIFHASSGNHILNHLNWIAERNRTNVINGRDLWTRRNELLPNLKFCESTSEQIMALQEGHLMLRPIIRRLFELENYCKSWKIGAFSPEILPCLTTTESQVTLQKYGAERSFLCPDTQKRIFSWHVRLTPMAWRIYFIPEEPNLSNQTGKMTIGYIGSHLRTARFN
jgi:hypothetical protein